MEEVDDEEEAEEGELEDAVPGREGHLLPGVFSLFGWRKVSFGKGRGMFWSKGAEGSLFRSMGREGERGSARGESWR